jgi:hypothetical protein
MLATGRLLGQTAGAVTTSVFFALAGASEALSPIRVGAFLAVAATLISLSRMGMTAKA